MTRPNGRRLKRVRLGFALAAVVMLLVSAVPAAITEREPLLPLSVLLTGVSLLFLPYGLYLIFVRSRVGTFAIGSILDLTVLCLLIWVGLMNERHGTAIVLVFTGSLWMLGAAGLIAELLIFRPLERRALQRRAGPPGS